MNCEWKITYNWYLGSDNVPYDDDNSDPDYIPDASVTDDYDPCDPDDPEYDPDYHLYDVKCSHEDFFDSQGIQKLEESLNLKDKDVKYCCENHGFVYQHGCKVLYEHNWNNW